MKIPIFSKRHKESIKKGLITIGLDALTKQRILYTINIFNRPTWHSNPFGHDSESDLVFDVGKELCREHGWSDLKSFVPQKQNMQSVDAQDFIKYGAPHYIFDYIEVYSRNAADQKYEFQKKINEIFNDAQLSWRLTDDIIFKIDSDYMSEVLSSVSLLLKRQGFEGALQEFQMARTHFESGDYKGAIHHANQSIESTMKSLLSVEKEKPGKLIRMIIDQGLIPSYYDDFLTNFEQILRSVNVARNEEAGHGQGSKVKAVPPPLAGLVINICASLIIYLINQHIDAKPVSIDADTQQVDDDIPF